jgi:hypothetical protein
MVINPIIVALASTAAERLRIAASSWYISHLETRSFGLDARLTKTLAFEPSTLLPHLWRCGSALASNAGVACGNLRQRAARNGYASVKHFR